jgi:6-phosphogluconolactonase (cycloisomerase 2 family)
MRKLVGLAVSLLLLLATPLTVAAGQGQSYPGAVYTMTNGAAGNEVLVYPRAARGALGAPVAYATGGLGTGGGLGNQSGLVLTHDDRWLVVVNAGSNTLSVFAVTADGLQLVDQADSHGTLPVSVTVDRDLVYVVNAGGNVGGTDNVAGFRLSPHGQLTYLEGSSRPLSAAATGPAQVGIDPSGRVLVVTEKGTNLVDTFALGRDGVAIAPVPNTFPAPNATPFGFDFGKRGQLFVSEAGGGAPGAGSASSWLVGANGNLTLISGAVATTQTAACWLIVTNDGRYAYTANTPDSSVSGFGIAPDGTLTLLDDRAGEPGTGPVDMAFSNDGRNLYTLNSSGATISVFRVNPQGRLSKTGPDVTVPAGANGLAAR